MSTKICSLNDNPRKPSNNVCDGVEFGVDGVEFGVDTFSSSCFVFQNPSWTNNLVIK